MAPAEMHAAPMATTDEMHPAAMAATMGSIGRSRPQSHDGNSSKPYKHLCLAANFKVLLPASFGRSANHKANKQGKGWFRNEVVGNRPHLPA
jgi:hypothetical protein